MNKYSPIKCAHYDLIELACIRQKPLIIEMINGEKIQGTAITVETTSNKCEWLTLDTSSCLRKIRLDRIAFIHQQEGFDSINLSPDR